MSSRAPSTDESDRYEPLRAELEDLARTRNYAQLHLASFPILSELAGPDGGFDEIHRLIGEAAGRMPEREASAVSILMGDTDDRWGRNLRERMTGAGKRLGIGSYNTFRDRSGDLGQSPYDQFLLKLARRISTVADTPPNRIAPGIAPTSPLVGAEEVTPPSRGNRFVLPTVVVAILAVLGGIVLTRQSSDTTIHPDDDGRIAGCNIPLGATMTPGGSPDGLAALIRVAMEDQGGVAKTGCPAHTVGVYFYEEPDFVGFSDLWAQEFLGTDQGPQGTIIVDLASRHSQWIDRNLAGGYFGRIGMLARLQDGLPVATDMYGKNPVAHLQGGGILIGHGLDGPAMYIPGLAMGRWEGLGGWDGELGLPMADINYRDGRLAQDYEGGYMYQNTDGEILAVVVGDEQISEALAPVDEAIPGVLQGYDHTAWWIDGDRARHYIPSNEVLECLGGEPVIVLFEAPGWVSAQYPEGEPAACP